MSILSWVIGLVGTLGLFGLSAVLIVGVWQHDYQRAASIGQPTKSERRPRHTGWEQR